MEHPRPDRLEDQTGRAGEKKRHVGGERTLIDRAAGRSDARGGRLGRARHERAPSIGQGARDTSRPREHEHPVPFGDILCPVIRPLVLVTLLGLAASPVQAQNHAPGLGDRAHPALRRARQLVRRGDRLLAAGDRGSAIGYYRDAVRAAPRSPIGYVALGEAYRARRSFDDAQGPRSRPGSGTTPTTRRSGSASRRPIEIAARPSSPPREEGRDVQPLSGRDLLRAQQVEARIDDGPPAPVERPGVVVLEEEPARTQGQREDGGQTEDHAQSPAPRGAGCCGHGRARPEPVAATSWSTQRRMTSKASSPVAVEEGILQGLVLAEQATQQERASAQDRVQGHGADVLRRHPQDDPGGVEALAQRADECRAEGVDVLGLQAHALESARRLGVDEVGLVGRRRGLDRQAAAAVARVELREGRAHDVPRAQEQHAARVGQRLSKVGIHRAGTLRHLRGQKQAHPHRLDDRRIRPLGRRRHPGGPQDLRGPGCLRSRGHHGRDRAGHHRRARRLPHRSGRRGRAGSHGLRGLGAGSRQAGHVRERGGRGGPGPTPWELRRHWSWTRWRAPRTAPSSSTATVSRSCATCSCRARRWRHPMSPKRRSCSAARPTRSWPTRRAAVQRSWPSARGRSC